jgi:hypothetical protein
MCDGALDNRAETAVAVAVLAAWHIAKILGPFKAIDARRRETHVVLYQSMGQR